MLIFKQLCIADSPAQESVCKGTNLHRKIKLCWYLDNCASLIVLRKNRYVKDDNLHRYHIRQGVAEDPGLMHRVKKVAFRTRLQSVMPPRVYNHHFFTRNNSLLDLNWQCHAPKLMNVNQECHLLFCHSLLPLARHWCPVLVGTPEARFLYQRHLFVHLVHPSQPKSGKYTEARLLYQWCAPVYSMHNKSLLTYIFCPTEQSETVLPGMKSYAHLKHHSFDK